MLGSFTCLLIAHPMYEILSQKYFLSRKTIFGIAVELILFYSKLWDCVSLSYLIYLRITWAVLHIPPLLLLTFSCVCLPEIKSSRCCWNQPRSWDDNSTLSCWNKIFQVPFHLILTMIKSLMPEFYHIWFVFFF